MKRQQCLIILIGSLSIAFSQRVAPGVPPQHYVDPNQQHYQQAPPMQYVPAGQPMHQQPIQQQPMHQQPVHQQPIQHAPQPMHPQQPMHQQPIQQHPNTMQQQQQQQMGGGVPQQHMPPQHVLDTANLQGEKAHIQEHMDVPMDTSKMSEQELQFHYFKMHDSDHNNKLDGCELIKSLIHWHEKTNKDAGHHEDTHGAHGSHQEKIFSDEELVALIDPILAMDDTGRDGYIDYPEFIKAQQKAASQKAEKP